MQSTCNFGVGRPINVNKVAFPNPLRQLLSHSLSNHYFSTVSDTLARLMAHQHALGGNSVFSLHDRSDRVRAERADHFSGPSKLKDHGT